MLSIILSTALITSAVAARAGQFSFEKEETSESRVTPGALVPVTQGHAKLGAIEAELSGAALPISPTEKAIVGTMNVNNAQSGSDSISPAVGIEVQQELANRQVKLELGARFRNEGGITSVTAVPVGINQELSSGGISQFTGVRVLTQQNLMDIARIETALEAGFDISSGERQKALPDIRAKAGLSRKIGQNGFVGLDVVFIGNSKTLGENAVSSIENRGPGGAASTETRGSFRAGFEF